MPDYTAAPPRRQSAGEPRHRRGVRRAPLCTTPDLRLWAGGAMQARTATGTLRAAAADALDTVVTLLPRLLGFVLVLVVGWLLSYLLGRGVAAVLHAVRFH